MLKTKQRVEVSKRCPVQSSTNMLASKSLSMSAPGAINLDLTTVKFDSEIKKPRHSITTHTGLKVRWNYFKECCFFALANTSVTWLILAILRDEAYNYCL